MFRTTIHADETTDVGQAVADLRAKAERQGVPLASLELLTNAAEKILTDLVARGKQMAEIGSQVSASQTFKDEAYEVTVAFGAGQKRSFLKRLIDFIRGR